MDCPDVGWVENDEFLRAFGDRIRTERIPLNGSFEITKRCNLSCIHCYCEDRSVPPCHAEPSCRHGAASGDGEMSTELIERVITEAAGVGCLFTVLTGGEPLVHPDFERIYRHTKEAGLFVILFTNGTLIDDDVIRLLKRFPPRAVEVSLYGMTEETCQRVTGVPGALERCLHGIDLLDSAGIAYRLKSVPVAPNVHEFLAMQAFAEERGVTFRVDFAINGRTDGDIAPLAVRVPVEEAIALELRSEDRRRGWTEWQDKAQTIAKPGRLYNCGAAVCAFHVAAEGRLLSCPINSHITQDLRTTSFADAWQQLGEEITACTVPDDHICNHCPDRVFCTWCPAFSALENVDPSQPVQYLCDMAATRRAALTRGAPAGSAAEETNE
jgi:MoaA/NifB/PqqE/SkfB family radical SAM enzyme